MATTAARSYCVKPCPQIRERRSRVPCRPLTPDPPRPGHLRL